MGTYTYATIIFLIGCFLSADHIGVNFCICFIGADIVNKLEKLLSRQRKAELADEEKALEEKRLWK